MFKIKKIVTDWDAVTCNLKDLLQVPGSFDLHDFDESNFCLSNIGI